MRIVRINLMVRLVAARIGNCIAIHEDSFEHLMFCLDQQKHMNEVNPDKDIIEVQKAIDDFSKQCWDMFTGYPGVTDCLKSTLEDPVSEFNSYIAYPDATD